MSDHGLARVDRHTDISIELEAIGLPVLRHPVIWRREPKAAVMVSGNGSVQVYLRPGVTRSERYTITQIERGGVDGVPTFLPRYLASLPGVAMVVGTDGPGLCLISRSGRARLLADGDGHIRYAPETADVLRLGGGGVHTEREWLERTLDTPFPDAPAQLFQVFRSRRAGDLVVVAEAGSDLRLDWEIPEHHSGHGSLIADHMRCLVACNMPIAGPVRTVDLFPLILEYLDIPVPQEIDGVAPRLGAVRRT